MDTPRISLTDFIDFINRPSMAAKLAKVREIKQRGPYTSFSDYYRPIREAVVRTHAAGRDKWAIRATIARLAAVGMEHAERLPRYEMLADAYIGWWGQRNLEWFEPGWQIGSMMGLPISINPELGLEIEGTPHIVKLYFKEDPLPRPSAEVAARMMSRVLAGQTPRGAKMAILDVRRRHLHRMTERNDFDVILDGEVAAFSALWAQA